MAYGGINKWMPSWKSGGIPRVSARFSLSVENEQADAGRHGRTRLARPSFQARAETGEYSFFLFNSRRADWQTYPVDLYFAIICDDHTYILYKSAQIK